jgi:hypothetical protein
LRSDGGVKCWGAKHSGQLGDGTRQDVRTPKDVVGLTSGQIDLVAGDHHACSLGTNGVVKCWGLNTSGQLGDGTNGFRLFAGPVQGLSTGVVAIAAGAAHTCAIVAGGAVRCWGSNNSGQVGENGATSFFGTLVPVDVPLPEPAVAITAGYAHTCALLSSGKARCWGLSSSSQLGNGDTEASSSPRTVVTADFSTSVSVTSQPNPSRTGEPVVITAAINSTDVLPTGSVVFRDGANPLWCGFNGATVSVAAGKAQCHAGLLAGVHTLTAEYQGDQSLLPSSGTTTHTVIAVAGQHCSGFDDVDAGSAFCQNVEWMRNRGVSLGCSAFAFCPSDQVSRLSMAAFMSRLGRALSPDVLSTSEHYVNPLHVGNAQPICQLPSIAVADYPRRVYVDAVVSGSTLTDADLGLEVLYEQFPLAVVGPMSRGFVRGGHFSTLRAAHTIDVPAGAGPWFAVRITRFAGSPDFVNDAKCFVRVMLFNRNETFSPFDREH